MMLDARQAAYLHALGVDVYVARDAAPSVPPRDVPVAAGETAAVAEPVALAAAAVATTAPSPAAVRPAAVKMALPPPASTATDGPDVSGHDWDPLRAAVAACVRCELHATRTQTVFGVGDPAARWMFIGEAPGFEEDRRGEPFVGPAGRMLSAMLRSIGLRRDDVYIANVVKCRPPNNRDPRPTETASCRRFLERKVALIDPTLVIAVGRVSAQTLLATDAAVGRLRGKVHAFGSRAWPVVVFYHPSYLLRTPSSKRQAWQDLLFARQQFARLQAAAGTVGR